MWIALIIQLLGGIGLFVEALRSVLDIAVVILLIGALTCWRGRRI